MSGSDTADWQGVGDAFRALGRQLKDHAVGSSDAVRAATDATDGGVVDGLTAALKAGLAGLDATTTDPEVAAAAKQATVRFLDAVTAELRDPPPDDEPA